MWILPSYNRSEQCREVIGRIKKMGCSTPGIVVINGESVTEYLMWKNELPENWHMVTMRENIGLCGAMRWAFREYPNEPWYGTFGDDDFIETPDWDKKLIEAAGSIYLSHGNNGGTSKVNPHGFMVCGGDLVRVVGNFSPDRLWHWYIDAFWEVIAKKCGIRKFCEDVKCTSIHHTLGTAVFDETYRMGESKKDADQLCFINWLRDTSDKGMSAICQRVKSELELSRSQNPV